MNPSIILTYLMRALVLIFLLISFQILWRGHNLPGGGFIAGIVVGIAFIMQYIASGYAWAQERARFNPQMMIGAGILLAGLTGVGSMFFDHAFLTSTHRYFDLPLIGQVELASAVAFDLGVFLTVVGTVLLTLATISRVEGVGDAWQPEDLMAQADHRLEATTVPARQEEPV